MIKMSCEMIGMTQLASESGLAMKGNMFADLSAALGSAKRRGSGKMRHVMIGTLWIQETNEIGELQNTKVQGDSNPADLMSKNVNRRTWTRWQHYSSNTSKEDGPRTQCTCRPPAAIPFSGGIFDRLPFGIVVFSALPFRFFFCC